MRLIYRYFIDAIQSYKRLFIISLIIVFLMTIMNMVLPYGIRLYLDVLIENGNWQYFIMGLILFGGYLLICTLVKIIWYASLDNFGGQYIKDLELEMETAISQTSLKKIDELSLNRIKHIMYADLLDVFRVIGHHMPSVFGSLLVIVAILILAFVYDPLVTVFLFFSLIIGLCISFFSRKIIARMASNTNSALKKMNTDTNEFIDLMMLHQTNHILDYFLNKTSSTIHSFIQTAKREDKIIYFFTGLMNNYNTLFRIALSAFLSLPVINGSIVNLVFFTLLSNIVMEEGQKLEQLIQQIMKSYISFENVEKLKSLQPRQLENTTLNDIESIKFHNVSFSYQENSKHIFENINCEFKKNDCIRLIGENGSGKSTLVKMILGLYSPDSGSVTINDRNIADYTQESLNSEILYLSQEEKFLNTTIEEYLRIISNDNIDNNKIDKCSQFAHFDVRMDTVIENNGQSLSAGQQKKLLLMKLLLRIETSSVIILDEVEAGLDQPTKQRYYDFINQSCRDLNKIFIVISHEKNADFISFNKEVQIINGKMFISSLN